METASRRRVRALPGARLAARALAALLAGALGMGTAPAAPQAGRMLLASEGGAQAARERLACTGAEHLVLSPDADVFLLALAAPAEKVYVLNPRPEKRHRAAAFFSPALPRCPFAAGRTGHAPTAGSARWWAGSPLAQDRRLAGSGLATPPRGARLPDIPVAIIQE